jgi:hypothetical protein
MVYIREPDPGASLSDRPSRSRCSTTTVVTSGSADRVAHLHPFQDRGELRTVAGLSVLRSSLLVLAPVFGLDGHFQGRQLLGVQGRPGGVMVDPGGRRVRADQTHADQAHVGLAAGGGPGDHRA